MCLGVPRRDLVLETNKEKQVKKTSNPRSFVIRRGGFQTSVFFVVFFYLSDIMDKAN